MIFVEEELRSRSSRPGRPASVPAPEMKDRADSGSQSTTAGKGMKSIKEKLMTRPRNRSRVDYDELAQVRNVSESSLKGHLLHIGQNYSSIDKELLFYMKLLLEQRE